MLTSFRRFSESWYAKVLLVVVILPFVFWGMGNSFSGGSKNVVVKIDKEKFTTSDFERFINIYGPQARQITPEEIDKLLTKFIGDKLIEMEYKFYNIKLSDESLSDLLKNQNEFKRDNKFSRTEYEKFLLTNNLSAVTFEKNLSDQEKKKQLLNLIGGGIVPSEFSINNTYNKINQKRIIEIINLNDLFSDLNLTENEIQTYYQKNKANYKRIYKSVKILEINPKNLIGVDDFNNIFFKKIDEIQDKIIQGQNADEISKIYNLGKIDIFKINKAGEDINNKIINEVPESLIKSIFLLDEIEPTTLVDIKDKFYILELIKTEEVIKDLRDQSVRLNVSENIKIKKKGKLITKMADELKSNTFTKLKFDKFAKDKKIEIKKVILNNNSDNKMIERDLVSKIYTLYEKQIVILNDAQLSKIFLVYVKSIENASISNNTQEYDKYLKLSKIRIANNLFDTYDNYIKKKYEIDINYKALNIVKNYFN